ncbi:MAG: hypothetical protein ACPGSM_01540, partial [Thiolinea sp.]
MKNMPGKTQTRHGLNASACCYLALIFLVFLLSTIPASLVYAADAQPSAAATGQSQHESKLHYTVRSGDSLLRISKRLKLPDTHYYQAAVALFVKNPQAFAAKSLHKLKAGAKLTLPVASEAAAIPLKQAKKIIAQGRISKQQATLLKTPRKKLTTKTSDTGTKTTKKQSTPAIVSQHSTTSEKQPTPPAVSQSSTTTLQQVQQQVNDREQALLTKVESIRTDLKMMENSLPSSAQREENRQQYLQSTKELTKKLEKLSAERKKQQADFNNKRSQLSAQKQELLQKRPLYQQSYKSLNSNDERTRFLLPKDYSYSKGIKPDQYFLNIAIRNRQQKPLSPLLNKTEALHCAVQQQKAGSILETLLNISPEKQNWPDEFLGQKKHTAKIHAGTMDILLATLHRNIQRFPDLTELSERVALQWNYCTIVGANNTFHNLTLSRDLLNSFKAANDAPLKWSGFRRWGFTTPVSDERYSPQLLEVREPYHAYELFFHRIHRKQCFPHPVTGERRFDTATETGIADRAFMPPPPEETEEAYPYTWSPLCEIPTVKVSSQTAWTTPFLTRAKDKLDKLNRQIGGISATLASLESNHADKQKRITLSEQQLMAQLDQLETDEQEQQGNLDFQLAEIQNLRSLVNQAEDYNRQKIAMIRTALEKRVMEAHVKHEAEIAQKKAAAQALRGKGYKARYKHLMIRKIVVQNKQISHQQRYLAELAAEQAQRLSAFKARQKAGRQRLAKLREQLRLEEQAAKERLRILNKQLKLAEAELTAENTRLAALEKTNKKRLAAQKTAQERAAALASLSKQLHNTPKVSFDKPATPKENFIPIADSGSATNVATPQSESADKKLGITATAIYTHLLSGDPSATLSVSWKPLENWFARTSLKYVKGEELTYNWGIGYSDWRPGTTSVQLNNWGPIKSGEGLDLDDAIFSISHKVDSEFLRDKKLATTLGISQPLSGDPAFNATFQWSPIKNWYFRTTASQNLHGGPTKWSYGFGYFDWR